MKDVFLSHTGADKHWVEALAARLEQEQVNGRPLDVWFDAWDIDFGENIVAKIEEGLKESRLVAVVLSPAFTKAAWPTVEWQWQVFADPAGRLARILPILLRKFDPETGEPVEIPFPLRSLKYFDFSDPGNEEREYQRLLARIRGERPARGRRRPQLAEAPGPAGGEEPEAGSEWLPVSASEGDEDDRWGAVTDCSAELERHRDLVGREWLQMRTERHLGGCDGRYLLLVGGPGIGKSAFLSELIRGEGGSACYHFIAKGMGDWDSPSTIVQSLAAQLRRRFRLPLTEADRALSPEAAFHRVLQQAGAMVVPGQKVVLYLDGLDEAFGPGGRFAQTRLEGFLPSHLPSGICCIVTSRPGSHLAWLEDRSRCTTVSLEPEIADNVEDIRRYFRRENARQGLGLSDEFIQRLTAASEGYFAAAVQYVHPAQPREDDLTRWQVDPAGIPRGLDGWIRALWDRIESSLPPSLDRRLLRAVLGVLAASRDPMSRASLHACLRGAAASPPPRDRIGSVPVQQILAHLDDVLQQLAELFDRWDSSGSSESRYRFFHTSVQEYAVAQAAGEIQDCHRLLGEYYQSNGAEPRNQVEAFYQFIQAGEVERAVLDLVQNEKYIFDLGYTGFLDECLQRFPVRFEVYDLFFKASEHLIRGKVRYYQGDFGGALEYLEHTFRAVKAGGDREKFGPLQVAALEYRGLTLRKLERFTEAVQDFAACRDLARELGYPFWEAHALSDLGMIYREQGDYPAAIEQIRSGIARRTKLLQDMEIGRPLPHVYHWSVPLAHVQLSDQYALLTYCHLGLAELKEAQRAIHRGWDHLARSEPYGRESYYRGRLLCASALEAAHRGDWDQAERFAEEAFQFPRSRKNRMGEIAGTYCLGIIYLMRAAASRDTDVFRQATHVLEECLEQLRHDYPSGMPLKLAKIHGALELAFTGLDDAERARLHGEAAHALARRAGVSTGRIEVFSPLI